MNFYLSLLSNSLIPRRPLRMMSLMDGLDAFLQLENAKKL